jgi:hypothetical protein
MRTDKQNETSRKNGAKSNGPVTAEGKAKSSRNAERHNLCSSGGLVLLTSEDHEAYYHLVDDFLCRFLPVDGVELELVYKLIACAWRERRIDGMETALLELEMLRQEPEVNDKYLEISSPARHALALFGTDDTKTAAALLLRYGAATQRSFSAALKALRELQGDRFNRRPHAAPQPKGPRIDPTGRVRKPSGPPTPLPPQQQEQNEPATAAASNDTPVTVNRRRPVVAALIVLRRRHAIAVAANSVAQPDLFELPNEPKAAAAGAASGLAVSHVAAGRIA